MGERPISLKHLGAATKRVRANLLPNLKDHEIKVLRALGELGSASPADREFQRKTQLSRPRLTILLNRLVQKRLVEKAKKGRKSIYSVTSYLKPVLV